jgi:glycosyltransferase involved in cell wall biosynthesis
LNSHADVQRLRGRRLYFLHTNPAYLVGLRLPMLVALVKAGCDVTAFAPGLGEEHARVLREHGITGRELSIRAAGMNPFLDVLDTARMVRLFRSERPDIVFGNNIKPVVFGTIAAALARVRMRYALVGGLGYAFTAIPHGPVPFARRLSGLIASGLYAVSFRLASAMVFHNRDDVELLTRRRICPPGKASVVSGSGVDTDAYSPGDRVAVPRFVFVGRMLADKGVREFLQAARQVKHACPEATFLLVGAVDANPSAIGRDEIDGYVQSGDVEWVGKVSDVRPYLRESSVFVLPSYREGLPRSTLEAMACGLAVITTDAPGCRDTVEQGVNGLAVPVGDAVALAGAMQSLCDNAGLRDSMGRESRRMAVARFSCETVNRDIVALLEKGIV